MPTLATMPYAQYLETDHWHKVRSRALRRAARRCQICGARGHLDVHHNTYARRGRELPSDVVVLCRVCHDLYHGQGALPVPPKTRRASGPQPAVARVICKAG